MAQAVIHIKFDPEQVAELADAVAARLGQGQWPRQGAAVGGNEGAVSYPPVTSSPEPQAAHGGQVPQGGPHPSQEPVDPWTGQAAQAAPYAGSAPAPAVQGQHSAPTASPVASAPQTPMQASAPQQVPQPPSCVHGPMIPRAAGIAKSGPRAGQPYPAFYACPTPRNAPDKCRSVSA